MLLAGRVDSPQVDTASGQVRMRLMEALRTAARPQDEELMTAACAGRAALCLDDDSDLDGSPPGEGCRPAGRAGAWRRGSARPAAPALVPIWVGGVSVRAAVLRRVLWVESSPEAMSAIAEEVSKELVPPALRSARERARVMRAEALGCQPEGFQVAGESLHGKVHFSSDKQSWVAVYVSETGRRSFTVKGLRCADERRLRRDIGGGGVPRGDAGQAAARQGAVERAGQERARADPHLLSGGEPGG